LLLYNIKINSVADKYKITFSSKSPNYLFNPEKYNLKAVASAFSAEVNYSTDINIKNYKKKKDNKNIINANSISDSNDKISAINNYLVSENFLSLKNQLTNNNANNNKLFSAMTSNNNLFNAIDNIHTSDNNNINNSFLKNYDGSYDESSNRNRKNKRKSDIDVDDDYHNIDDDNSEDESTNKKRKRKQKLKISSVEKKLNTESKKNTIKKTQLEISEKPYDCFTIYSTSEKTFQIQNSFETKYEGNELITLSIEFKNYFVRKVNEINTNVIDIKKAVFELCCILFCQLQTTNKKLVNFPQLHEALVKKFLKDIGCYTPQCRRFTYYAIEAFYIGFLNTFLKQNIDYQCKFELEDFCENQYFSENNNNVIYQFIKSCGINSIIQLIVVLQCKLCQNENSGFIDSTEIEDCKSKCTEVQLKLHNNFPSHNNAKIRIFRNIEEIKQTKKEEKLNKQKEKLNKQKEKKEKKNENINYNTNITTEKTITNNDNNIKNDSAQIDLNDSNNINNNTYITTEKTITNDNNIKNDSEQIDLNNSNNINNNTYITTEKTITNDNNIKNDSEQIDLNNSNNINNNIKNDSEQIDLNNSNNINNNTYITTEKTITNDNNIKNDSEQIDLNNSNNINNNIKNDSEQIDLNDSNNINNNIKNDSERIDLNDSKNI
jgi:hypothetical protein